MRPCLLGVSRNTDDTGFSHLPSVLRFHLLIFMQDVFFGNCPSIICIYMWSSQTPMSTFTEFWQRGGDSTSFSYDCKDTAVGC